MTLNIESGHLLSLFSQNKIGFQLTDKTKQQTEKEKKITDIAPREPGSHKRKDASSSSHSTKKPRKEYTRRVQLTSTPLLASTPLPVSERLAQAPKSSSSSQVHLPIPESQKSFSVKFTSSDRSEANQETVEIENDVVVAGTTLHKIKCMDNGEVSWETILQSKGLSATGNSHSVCVSCEDKSLHCFTSSGRRMLPPILLPAQVSHLHSNSHFVMALTTNGRLYVWDIQSALQH
ncbi:hypothetical protein BSL78_03027 [Apostichopus japonicus]|uniref:Protein HIRA-like C-terminal domain-containing protein n=1 Tax=Stichopus japonicus TaxID=307972 RepID=A0A2G8LIF3_STIJA|nr:hypothetical protein BSL78_03027 [Apostichopus japonicus]